MPRLTVSTLLKITVSIILFTILFAFVDLSHVWNAVSGLNPVLLGAYALLLIMLNMVYGYRWALLTVKEIDLQTTLQFFSAVLRGNFYNLFLPSTIGGDLFKWGSLRKLVPTTRLIVSVIMDRIMGLAGVIILGGLSLLAMHQLSLEVYQLLPVELIWLVAGLDLATIAFLVIVPARIWNMLKSLLPLQRLKLSQHIEKYLHQFQSRFWKGVVISASIQLITFIVQWLIAQELGLELSLTQLVAIMPLIYIVTTIPISFAGLGTTEAAYVFFLSLFSIPSETALSFALVLSALRIITAVFGWGVAELIVVNPQRKRSLQ